MQFNSRHFNSNILVNTKSPSQTLAILSPQTVTIWLVHKTVTGCLGLITAHQSLLIPTQTTYHCCGQTVVHSNHLFIYLSVCLSVCLSIHLSVSDRTVTLTMSDPPTNSPFTYSCGYVGQLENSFRPKRTCQWCVH